MRLLRRISQWTAIAILVALPMLSRGGALYEAFGAGARHLESLATPWERFLYASFSALFGGFEDPAGVAALFQGGYWSITLFGYTINDPLAALGHAVATGVVHWPLLLGTLIPVALAVLAGRVFCGWVCPVNTILEINGRLRRWLERRVVRVRLPNMVPSPRPRVVVLVMGLVVSALAGFNAFALILPYAGLARDWHLVVYGAGIGAGTFFIVVLLATELLVAPRLWCRSLCPAGLIFGWLGARHRLGIARRPQRSCTAGCKLCLTTCEVGVNPRDGIDTAQCMLCNECVARCPAEVLTIGPARRPWAPALSVTLGLVLLLGTLSFDAAAHHIKALPHYGYLENYPQTPAYEERVLVPPYEVTVVVYVLEGLDRGRSDTPDDATIFITVAEQGTGKPYTGRLEVTLRPLDGGGALTRSFRAPLEESVYRTRATLRAAAYDIAVRIPVEPAKTATLRLNLAAATNWWLIASLGVAAVVVAGVVAGVGRAAWRRRRRLPDQRQGDSR